ncbi:MAG TPA: EAL domain-containing protein [Burkholderiaceae bacterium]|nr:EAL domain-containing protein [Burkholderiaceae bacterium]
MAAHHSLLRRQLKKLGIDNAQQPPTAEQWSDFLARVNRAYGEGDQQRYLVERSQEVSSREMQDLYNRLEQAQRIAGLGHWSFDNLRQKGLWSEQCFRIVGLAPSSSPLNYRELSKQVHKDDRAYLKDRIHTALHENKDFELEFRVIVASGETRWVRVIGQPVKDSRDVVRRLHGTIMDVTRRKLVELRQSMEHTVTRLLAESDSPGKVMPEIIQSISETLGWAGGALWTVDKSESVLRRTATWSMPDLRVEEFFRQSKKTAPIFLVGGLLGRALNSGEPLWISDVTQDTNFARAPEALKGGLRAAFAFPIEAGGEILGIMELFAEQARQTDQEMLRSAHFIGRHIGQFLQREQAEAALRESEAHFRALVEQASDSFYVHDFDGRFIDVNQRGCDCLGYTRHELLNMSLADIDIDLSIKKLKTILGPLTTKEPIALESRHRHKDGTVFPVEIRIGPIEIGGHQYLLSLARDVTERKELQDHIQHLAYHDSLTGLPNRAMFNRHLSHAMLQARRYYKGLAVLFIDLDRFKNINDTLGHDAGDRLLQEMARRLTASLRDGDLVARLGGDEFVVLIEEVADLSDVSHIARQILSALVKEYPLDGQLINITASIGISTFPEDGRDEFSLMKHADVAMYRAKEGGKNKFQFYSAHMDLHSAAQLALESSLRRALERDELLLHYQAKVDARTGRITGVEVLARWQHPEFGLMHPEHFIPLAEETGLIVPLTRWILREACSQNRAWQKQGLPAMRIAVNLSARQFADENLLGDVASTLHDIGMDPTLLELEITESMMMHDTGKTIQVLAGLKAMGVHIAIDDFGIGYSSLSHLKQFPIDIIKIDRSFITDIPGNQADEAITDAIIAMGKSLKILVVAEGVEALEQLQFLRSRGCDEVQGYFFSRPIPANDFAKLLRKNLASSALPLVAEGNATPRQMPQPSHLPALADRSLNKKITSI